MNRVHSHVLEARVLRRGRNKRELLTEINWGGAWVYKEVPEVRTKILRHVPGA